MLCSITKYALTTKITKDAKGRITKTPNFMLFVSFVMKNSFPFGCGFAALGYIQYC